MLKLVITFFVTLFSSLCFGRYTTISYISLDDVKRIYQKGIHYEIYLNQHNYLNGHFESLSSNFIFICMKECYLELVNSSLVLQKSEFYLENVLFNVSISDSNLFIFDLDENSVLTLHVICFDNLNSLIHK